MEHTSHRDDVFYCYYVKTDTVLSFYSDTKNFFIGKKKTFICAKILPQCFDSKLIFSYSKKH